METENKKEKKNDAVISVRLPANLDYLLRLKAHEKRTTPSEIIRQCCTEYFDSPTEKPEIIALSIMELKKQMTLIEHKTDIQAIILLEMMKKLFQRIPSNKYISEEVVDIEFERFIDECRKSVASSGGSILEAMILDFYKNGGDN